MLKLLRKIGIDDEYIIVRPITCTRIRDNAVYYDAVALFSTKRDQFRQHIVSSIEQDFRSCRLISEKLLVRNVTYQAV